MSFNFPPFLLGDMHAPFLAGSMGAAFTIIIERCAARYRWHGATLLHHTHTGPVPRVGGIAVVLAVFAAYLASVFLSPVEQHAGAAAILLCSLPVLLVGAYDDFRHTSPRTKLIVQILAATLFAWAVTGSVVFHEAHAMLWMGTLVAWLVITTNSFNLIDGVDGLAAGTAAMMGMSLAVINASFGNKQLAALSLAIAAACISFLPFNVMGKRIFLGDSGSLAIGFMLAALAALTARETHNYLAAAILYGFPITETVLTVARRKLKGRSIFKPDREHLHHKLRNAGLSPVRTICVLYLINAAFNGLGMMVFLGASTWTGVGSALLVFFLIAYSFGYCSSRSWRKFRRCVALGQTTPMEGVSRYVSYGSGYSFGAKNSNT